MKVKVLLTLLLFLGLVSNKYSQQKLNKKFTAKKIIDLTHSMHDEMAYWPGGVPFKKDRLVDYDQGYQLHKFTLGENTGTHVDAPSHFIKGKNSIDKIPLNQLVLPIIVINVEKQSKKNSDYQLTISDIKKWEKKNGKIPAGSLVILNTGWFKKFKNPKKYINMDNEKIMHFPGFSPKSANFLLKRKITAVGIDTLSIDYGKSKDFVSHSIFLKANKFQIENMANLDALPSKGAVAVIGVLPIKDGSQAQARIFAFTK